MANKKFSEFELKTTTSDVSHIVGYNGAENVQITPANFIIGSGGPFLPLAGGTMTGNTIHNDNVKSIFGSPGNDLQIYHDSSNSYIQDVGQGGLVISASDLYLRNPAGADYITSSSGGTTKLFFDGSEKLATTSTGISVTGKGLFSDDVNINQSTDVGVLNTTNLESGAAVGLSLTYPTSNVDAGDGLAISIGISGRGRSYIANSNLTTNLDASNLEFYTENGGVINKVLTLSESKDATFTGNVSVPASKYLEAVHTDNTYARLKGNGLFFNRSNVFIAAETDNFATLNLGYSSVRWGNVEINAASTKFLNGSSERMRLDSSGNLGVGTSTPFGKLSVNVTSGAPATSGNMTNALTVHNTDGGRAIQLGVDESAGLTFINSGYVNNAGIAQPIAFYTGGSEKMRIAAAGEIQFGTGSNNAGFIDFDGTSVQINTQRNPNTGAFVDTAKSNASINLVGADGGSYIKFNTNDVNNATANERMRLTPTGNLGVGTSTPTVKLEVNGDIKSTNIGISGFITHNGDSGTFMGWSADDTNVFYTAGNERLRIDASGNLGVGTQTPTARITLADHTTAAGGIKFRSAASSVSLYSQGSGTLTTNGSFNVGARVRIAGGNAASDPDVGLSQTGGIGFTRVSTNDIAFITSSSERMRLNAAGDLLIGTTGTPNGTSVYGSGFIASGNNRMILKLASSNTSSSGLVDFFNPNGLVGFISTSGSSTAYNTSSDYRLKEDLQDFKGLDLVSKIPVYDFKWKSDESRSYGVMAHELEEVLPQAVTGDKDAEKMQSVDYSKIVPLLVKSIQELSAKLEALECQCEKK